MGVTPGQTTVQQCDFCGELAEDQIVIEPSRKVATPKGPGLVAERRAWVCHRRAQVVRAGPVKAPRSRLAPGVNRFGGSKVEK